MHGMDSVTRVSAKNTDSRRRWRHATSETEGLHEVPAIFLNTRGQAVQEEHAARRASAVLARMIVAAVTTDADATWEAGSVEGYLLSPKKQRSVHRCTPL